jgi:hypothetical protein
MVVLYKIELENSRFNAVSNGRHLYALMSILPRSLKNTGSYKRGGLITGEDLIGQLIR